MDTLTVEGRTEPRLCGGGICGGPLEYPGACLQDLVTDTEWLSARLLLEFVGGYDHRFELAVSTAGAWDGRDGSGRRVASGVYFTRFETPDFSASSRIVRY